MPNDPAFAAIGERLRQRRMELTSGDRRVQSQASRSGRGITADFEDQGNSADYDDSMDAMDPHTMAELAEINAALDRLADGTYGTCSSCKRPIEASRLAMFPLAATCQACAGRR